MELSESVKNKLQEAVEEWAYENLDGLPFVLGYATYYQLEKKLIEQTEKIKETFSSTNTENVGPSHSKAQCCFIMCENKPDFEIWFDGIQTVDNNTLCCSNHLVEMLDGTDLAIISRYADKKVTVKRPAPQSPANVRHVTPKQGHNPAHTHVNVPKSIAKKVTSK